MSDIVSSINSLPGLAPLTPGTPEAVAEAENALGLKFSEEYKESVYAVGAVYANGIEFTGIAKSETRNVVTVTEKEREYNPQVPMHLYVVENPGMDRIIIWQDQAGTIYKTSPYRDPVKIASSLNEYVLELKKLLS
ncbi:MAG: SMI1/KNR4 family protein [Clostridiales bacterium]|jgi:hypothetical protein|nr:SMI1/KNR4 family protein [Clostridiales bacterium]